MLTSKTALSFKREPQHFAIERCKVPPDVSELAESETALQEVIYCDAQNAMMLC